MKRLFIIVEGQTEEEFVKELLRNYLYRYGIQSVTPIAIHTGGRHHKGGFVNYDHLKNDAMRLLRSQKDDIFVTTFVDFFRIPSSVPGYETIKTSGSHEEQVAKLEKAIDNDINDKRFHSYIQLHEFEALLFSSASGFRAYLDEKAANALDEVRNTFANPEDINTSASGAPSKRILQVSPGYKKIVDGNLIASEVGMKTMLEQCPRFRAWVEMLLDRCK